MKKERRIQRNRRGEDVYQKRYEMLVKQIDQGFCIIEVIFDKKNKPVDYKFLEVNEQFEEQTGIHGALGKRMRDIAPEHEEYWFEKYGKVAVSGKPVHFGSYAKMFGRWFEVYATKVGKKDEPFVALLFRDITELKLIEDALAASEEKYRSAFNSMDQGFLLGKIVRDTEKNVSDVLIQETNPAYVKMRDIPEKEIVGHLASEFIPSFHDVWLPVLRKIVHSGKTLRVERKASAVDRWFSFYGTLVGDKTNEKLACIFSDITDRKKIQEKLEESLKSRDEFISIATHELKTPVTSLKVLAEVSQLLYAKRGDVETVDIFKDMNEQFDKLTSLINDLLDATRIKEGKLLLRKDHFDFDKLLERTIKELTIISDKHAIMNESERTDTLLCYGDQYRIGQVITNLLTNAMKYSPNAHKIIVRSKMDANGITFSVQDFGIGIEENKRKEIFERFFQTDSSIKSSKSGLGLGLYISKNIIDRHRGKLWVESIIGKGSTFFFTLPFKKVSK